MRFPATAPPSVFSPHLPTGNLNESSKVLTSYYWALREAEHRLCSYLIGSKGTSESESFSFSPLSRTYEQPGDWLALYRGRNTPQCHYAIFHTTFQLLTRCIAIAAFTGFPLRRALPDCGVFLHVGSFTRTRPSLGLPSARWLS